MATCQSLIDDVRSRIVESSAQYFSDAEIVRWLNQGYKHFISKTEWAEKCVAYPMVVNQFEYDLPSDVIKVYDIRYQDKFKVWFRDQEEWGRLIGSAGEVPGPRPYMWRQFPWFTKLRINPYPSANSATTTVTDVTVSSSATTINVADTSSFPRYGRLRIGTATGEQVLYYNTSATAFLQCVRGDGASTAASMAQNDVVYAAPMEVYMQYQPADLATSPAQGTLIGPSYDECLINYACSVAMLKREKFDQAEIFRKLYDDQLAIAIAERRKMQLDRQFAIKDEDDYGLYYAWV